MKLRSLSVNQFKKFTSPTALDGLGDGLNIVVGPNELGKSTLLDALRAALFERHRAGGKTVRDLQNDRNRSAPVVRLEFEVDDSRFIISKRFLKKQYAQLVCGDGRVLEGDVAEDELRDLLGFSESRGRTAMPGMDSIWGVLWVAQGVSFDPIEVPESARGDLAGALEAEVGAVLGGRRGRELPRLVEQQLNELLTEQQRRPRGDYQAAIAEVEQLEADFDDEQERRNEMSATLDELANAEGHLSHLNEGGQEVRERADLKEAEEKLQQERERKTQIAAAENKLELLARDLDAARQAVQRRADQRQQLDQEDEALAGLGAELAELEEQEQARRDQFEQHRQRVQAADRAVATAEDAAERHRAVLAEIGLRREIGELERQRDQARQAAQRRSEARRRAEAILVDDAALEHIRAAELAAAEANARLQAAATAITFEIAPERLDGITVDGEPLPSGDATVRAVEPTVIVVPERGRIVVEPAIAERDALLRSLAGAEAALREALGAAAAESIGDAQAQHGLRQSAERDAELAEREMQMIIPGGDLASLDDRIEGLLRRFSDMPAAVDADALPSAEEAGAAVASAEEAIRSARRERAEAGAVIDEAQKTQEEFGGKIARFRADLQARNQAAAAIRQQLDEQTAEHPDEELASAVDAAAVAQADQQREVDELAARSDDAAAAQLEARVERLQGALDQRDQRRDELTIKIARLKERIEGQDAAGIDEQIAQTEHRLAVARQRLARFKRETEVLSLLSKALREAESGAKQRYLSPVIERVHPYLQMLFPDAQLEMDENLHITGMRRNGDRTESFGQLSKGTQEQIAVLVRLAFAELLVEQGRPAAVVLDDALVFSDDQRMQRMFDILHHAGQKVQILVFTCREQLFDGLGACRLSLTEGDAEQMASA